MATLADIAARIRPTKTIQVGDDTLIVRPLSLLENSMMQQADPIPEPPMRPAKGRGSLAPHEPDPTDPEYRRALSEWLVRQECSVAALATGEALPVDAAGGSPGSAQLATIKAWREQKARELGTLSQELLGRIARTSRELSGITEEVIAEAGKA